MVGEQQLSGFIKFYDQITVTVFQRIADQIAKDPGDGVPVQHTADFCIRHFNGGSNSTGAQGGIEAGYAVFQDAV